MKENNLFLSNGMLFFELFANINNYNVFCEHCRHKNYSTRSRFICEYKYYLPANIDNIKLYN
ncbi:hypothetical protein PFNF135_02367 [Plasmodium falciparum NF135/5.C10]|uniref:Uncharacterized protein n=1 Tax=Plasmodium falciparum NF135/5.C10 TaxID=1036726 RepID=W4IK27_PLAFA|nr:hypothetical protein PFNF135_02367 [Plasmodium falciparum NF135/5.C10]